MTRTGRGSHGSIPNATQAPVALSLTGPISSRDPHALLCMPPGARVALRKATLARRHHEGDEQPSFPPLPGDRYPSSGHALSDPPPAPLRIGQAAPVRCSPSTTAGPPRSARLPVPVASPTDRTIRPHRRAHYRPRAAFSAWAAQITSVATERDPAMVRAARSPAQLFCAGSSLRLWVSELAQIRSL
jgi:hypothetical protein